MITLNPPLLSLMHTIAAEAPAAVVTKTLSPGQALLRQGDEPQWVYVVKEGLLKSWVQEPNGKEYVVGFAGAGEILGEVEVFIKAPYLCSVSALKAAQLYRFNVHTFLSLMARHEHFRQAILAELAQRLYLSSRRAASQQLHPLEYSLLKLLLLAQPELGETTKADIAGYLGITVRSLNRALYQLQAKDILVISDGRGRIQVKSEEKLRQELQSYE